MKRALWIVGSALLPLSCAAPELGRDWPADHPLRAETSPEAPAAQVPSLAPLFELPGAQHAGSGHGHGDLRGHAPAHVGRMHPEVTGGALALELRQGAAVAAEVERLLAEPLDESGAVRLALLTSRRVRAQLERLDAARARAWQAGLLANPKLSVGLGLGGDGPSNLGLTLVQDLLSALRLPTRAELARAESSRVHTEVAAALADFVLEVRTRYFEAVAAREVVTHNAHIEEASSVAAELARRMHAAGNLSDRDYVAEVDAFEEARLAHAEAAAERVAAEERLHRALGVWAPGGSWSLPQALPAIPGREARLDGLERRALDERLDLAVAVRRSELAAAELGVARDWSFLGLLEIGVHAEREQGEWSVGPELTLEVPLFDRRSARRTDLAAELARADHGVFALALEVRSQVREARERLRALRARVEHARDVRLPAREALVRLTQERYDFMLAGTFELLAARRALDGARIAHAELRRDYWIARAGLERAIGGPLEIASEDPSPPDPAPKPSETPRPTPSHHHLHGAH